MELYIHIPFCARKCAYCDFLSFANRLDSAEEYKRALFRDVTAHGGIAIGEKPTVETIYIGGGTPSLMREGFYEELMAKVRDAFTVLPGAEISMECNPGTVTKEKLREYKEAGINRLSFGAQSANSSELSVLSRIHDWSEVEASVRMAREEGFDNINLDLMMNLPGQTCEGFCETLRAAVSLAPEHISAYSLIVEPGTAFYERYESHPELLPSEEEACRTYETAVKMLDEAGYAQYEISNFAKPGRECRHNIGYWKRDEYLGLGLGAASLIGEKRYAVTRDFEAYLSNCVYDSEESLSADEIRNETIILGLRMNEGISLSDYEKRFGTEAAERLTGKFKRFCNLKLAAKEGDRFFLTLRGFLVSNTILADLMD